MTPYEWTRPWGVHTMWARGQYTVKCHNVMNMHSAGKLTLRHEWGVGAL